MKDKIIQNIEFYHPTVNHYRRTHAPLRRYLPPELTVTEMHKDFIQSHSQEKVSYKSYKILNSMNISFTKLGEEQCELCGEHKHHQSQGKQVLNEQEG